MGLYCFIHVLIHVFVVLGLDFCVGFNYRECLLVVELGLQSDATFGAGSSHRY